MEKYLSLISELSKSSKIYFSPHFLNLQFLGCSCHKIFKCFFQVQKQWKTYVTKMKIGKHIERMHRSMLSKSALYDKSTSKRNRGHPARHRKTESWIRIHEKRLCKLTYQSSCKRRNRLPNFDFNFCHAKKSIVSWCSRLSLFNVL